MPSNPPVNLRRMERVAIIEMNRSQRRNAMNSSMLEALVAALKDLRYDKGSTSLVLTGAGTAFSAGADTSERLAAGDASARMRWFTTLYDLVTRFPKPTVAALPGPAVGGGAEVAAACDLRVGTGSAAFRFPGADFGIPVGSARLPLLVGLSHAKDLLLTGRTIGAEEAYRMGLLNRLVEPQELEHEAVALAEAMAARPGAAAQKRILDEVSGLTDRVWAENRKLAAWQRDSRS